MAKTCTDHPIEKSSEPGGKLSLPPVSMPPKGSSIVPSNISVAGTLGWRNLVEHFPLGNAADLFDVRPRGYLLVAFRGLEGV